MSPFAFRPADPMGKFFVDEIPLPESIWHALERAASEQGLSLGEAVAQIISDRYYANGTATDAAPVAVPRRRRRGKAVS